jgi:hypothetical protein
MSTPTRLRRTALLLLASAALTATAATVGTVRMDAAVHATASDAAPRAALASDLYFALSDLDNQVATLIMLGGDETLATNRLDALRTYQRRTTEVDVDLIELGRGDGDRGAVDQVADELRVYREWVWSAISAAATLPPVPAAEPPPTPTRGYYAEATTVLRGSLLPHVAAIRRAAADRLDAAYAGERSTAVGTAVVVGTLGIALVFWLVRVQIFVARRFRRVLNPGLAAATLIVAAVTVGVAALAVTTTTRLSAAQRDSFGPYLALTATQALGYDAAGDTSRYLIASDPSVVGASMRAKSACVGGTGPCPADVAKIADLGKNGVAAAWADYERDRDHAIALADAGSRTAAVGVLTSITSGGAAIDFDAYNRLVDLIGTDRRTAATTAFARIQSDVRPWVFIPGVAVVIAMILILGGIRARLAEYR